MRARPGSRRPRRPVHRPGGRARRAVPPVRAGRALARGARRRPRARGWARPRGPGAVRGRAGSRPPVPGAQPRLSACSTAAIAGEKRSQLRRGAVRLQERGGHLGEQRLLAAALLGLAGPMPRAYGKVADDDPDDEIDRQREPVFAVRETERVERWEEEEVEERRAGKCDRDRVRAPEERRDRQHGEEVEDAEAEDRDERLARIDRSGDDRKRTDAEEDSGSAPSKPPFDAVVRAHRATVVAERDARGPARGPALRPLRLLPRRRGSG